ncbi:MAG: hypothetical protein CVU54_11180 [Deltaproteobacteria bacterium HGW-Deltaproteobacteria-12]|nr:MAG: hypothetical protein CVU54_11180 [Deltaproteobacteria bacterium HGW-Deltaproteobacteria-12]
MLNIENEYSHTMNFIFVLQEFSTTRLIQKFVWNLKDQKMLGRHIFLSCTEKNILTGTENND